MTTKSTETQKGNKVGEDPDVLNKKSEDDHTRLRAEKFRAKTAGAAKPKKEAMDELPDYFETVSQIVDDNLFEPHFRSNSGVFERNISESMTDLKSIKKIDDLLRVTKVMAIVGCVFSFSLCLRSFARASPAYGILYGVISADALRISYNCYIKNYCAIALKKLGSDGNPAKIGAAVFQWAQSAMGVLNAEDPFMKLKKEIIWDVVIHNTISSQLYKKAQTFIASNR